MLISDSYKRLNQRLHQDDPTYGGESKDVAARYLVDLCHREGFSVVLDFGCGKGRLRPAVKALSTRLKILEFDPSIPGKDHLPTRRPDLVVALDVLEHVEPEHLEGVLSTIAGLRPRLFYAMIHLKEAQKTLADGRNAHLIVEPPEWWERAIGIYFKQVAGQREGHNFAYVGHPLPK